MSSTVAAAAAAGGQAAGGAATVVIAVRDSGRSRRAARWAAKNLVSKADRVVLIHVVPPVSFIPSPSGKRVPVVNMENNVVEIYDADRKSATREVFFQFRRFFGSRVVETKILDGQNPADTILRYVVDSRADNLVLGSSSYGWIWRLFKGQDVATSILKSSTNLCNVFVVSRRKLIIRYKDQAVTGGGTPNTGTQTISHKAFVHRKQKCLIEQLSFHTLVSVATSQTSEFVENNKYHQASRSGHVTPNNIEAYSPIASSHLSSKHSFHHSGTSGAHSEIATHHEASKHSHHISDASGAHSGIQAFRHTGENLETATVYSGLGSVSSSHSHEEDDVPDELARLRLEVKRTKAKYNQTCKELVVHKKEVASLMAECSEESKKIKDALEREENLRKVAEVEKLRLLETLKEVKKAKNLLAKEAVDRHKAEVAATKLSAEKSKVVDALFSGGKKCRLFSKKEIEDATGNFSNTNKIGEGGYGNVYKCHLDHTPAAVKVLKQDAFDKREEFFKEIEIFSQLHHPHVLLLLGVCPENGCLVYEYMENGSLEDQLFRRKEGEAPLPWFIRFKIIFEVACGLAFLHGMKPDAIVHRDMKPGNILLDHNYAAKIGDVGLAKLMSDVVPDGVTEYKDTIIAGTMFYLDPEYYRTGTVRPKSDLYALGMIALQLLTAKHPNGLIVAVEKAIKDHCLADVLDKSISDWPLVESEKLARLALWCTRMTCRERPDLETEVMPQLEELLDMANLCFKLRQQNVYAPCHYICPILQEVMRDPYIAGDGFTYEYVAIKAWLKKNHISPVTKRSFPHANLVPNNSLRAAIEASKSHASRS